MTSKTVNTRAVLAERVKAARDRGAITSDFCADILQAIQPVETKAGRSAFVHGFQADPVDVMRNGAVVYGSLTARDPNDVTRELWTVTSYWRRASRLPEEPEAECAHTLVMPESTLTVIDPFKAKCRVCYEFFDLPLNQL